MSKITHVVVIGDGAFGIPDFYGFPGYTEARMFLLGYTRPVKDRVWFEEANKRDSYMFRSEYAYVVERMDLGSDLTAGVVVQTHDSKIIRTRVFPNIISARAHISGFLEGLDMTKVEHEKTKDGHHVFGNGSIYIVEKKIYPIG
jgi:hypothetical protein